METLDLFNREAPVYTDQCGVCYQMPRSWELPRQDMLPHPYRWTYLASGASAFSTVYCAGFADLQKLIASWNVQGAGKWSYH